MGWLYEQVLEQPDSAIANYQRLRAKYPSSTYAARVQPKLVEVEMMIKAAADSAARKAAADSLAHRAVSDSVAQKAVPDSAAHKQAAPGDSLRQDVIDDELPPTARIPAAPGGPDSTALPPERASGHDGDTPASSPLLKSGKAETGMIQECCPVRGVREVAENVYVLAFHSPLINREGAAGAVPQHQGRGGIGPAAAPPVQRVQRRRRQPRDRLQCDRPRDRGAQGKATRRVHRCHRPARKTVFV